MSSPTRPSPPAPGPSPVNALFSTLHERAKELSCLYRIEEILSLFDVPLEEVFREVIEAIPPGLQCPDLCQARITYGTETYESPDYEESACVMTADIVVQEAVIGRVCISYRVPPATGGDSFLAEERKLISTIAERLGHFILHQRLRLMFEEMSGGRRDAAQAKPGWRIALDLLRNTDQNIFIQVSRKMMNYLGWRGVTEARDLLQRYGEDRRPDGVFAESNWPQQRESLDRFMKLSDETFALAEANLTADEIFARIQKWINEDRSASAVKDLEDVYATLEDVLDSLRKVQRLIPQGIRLPQSTQDSVRVALIRRFFTEQLEFINVAKKYVDLDDVFGLVERIIFPPGSHGKLGGKSAGLFLAARVLRQHRRRTKALGEIKTPRTWYITSDAIIEFLRYNDMEEVVEQKYKDIEEIRQEYPHLVQLFKNCVFPPAIVKGLSLALDDLGDVPLIVRSSSLLEDRLGTAFAGKYKSLFLANQGDKKARLDALLDAVAEVYASIFSPDPIQYRAERGLLDFYEEMGIMIQEVVGRRAGKYFFPAYAGVAFSRNEFLWSSRIRREDGLLRMVPGLGTRAVDRVSDDYPALVSPGRPQLRVNVSVDEVVRYSPKKVDVIDLEKNQFTTLPVAELLREVGRDYPAWSDVVSVYRDGILQRAMGVATDFSADDLVVTFEGVIGGKFLAQLEAILKTLESALGYPVDIEFACDGRDFYLLQCRPQSHAAEDVAMEIPAVPEESVLFTANRYISNGRVPDITHVVYVDPERYGDMGSLEDLYAVGEAVGKLNKVLPRKKFILMGPGRWGSRGDIKLGVRVTYSEINNTAMLIEVARKKGNYVPDVSFGTHFFQDLVESGIRYLPLYPDDPGVKFHEGFLLTAPNRLAELVPEAARLQDALRVIDVPKTTDGKVLRVLTNAGREQAVAYFADPGAEARPAEEAGSAGLAVAASGPSESQSRWRVRMAERIAALCDPVRWGVTGIWLHGSAKDGTATADNDIDLVVQVSGNVQQRRELESWLQGWSLALAETNYLRTGIHREGLLDVTIVTEEEAPSETQIAAKAGVPVDGLRELPLRTRSRAR